MALRTIAILLACAVIAFCAQGGQEPLSFEVASVKATPLSEQASQGRMTGAYRPGQFTWTHASLRLLILMAYDVPLYQFDRVSGLPTDRQQYDVVARVPAGTNREQFREMLQNLLAERFGLVIHWLQKDVPGYDLVVAKGGPKLREAEKRPADAPPVDPAQPLQWPAGDWPVLPPGIPHIGLYGARGNQISHLAARMQPVADLVRELQLMMDRPLTDKTGLTGTYDFTMDFVAPGTPAEPPASLESPDLATPAPDMFAALESQLGLKLVPSKTAEKLLVVDKVNLKPTGD
jgi:uncharacterized protein (TIGR03435 family)